MNGKIKTKFAALFAVALMITVCVVPVVGNEGTDAAPVSSSNGEVFEGYELKLFTEGMDNYDDLVYYGPQAVAGIASSDYAFIKKDTVDSTDVGYLVDKDTGLFLRFVDIPNYSVEYIVLPIVQLTYTYAGAGINAVDVDVVVKQGTSLDKEFENKGQTSDVVPETEITKKEGVFTFGLYAGQGTDNLGLTKAKAVGNFDVEITATQGITQQVIKETINAGKAIVISGKVNDAKGDAIGSVYDEEAFDSGLKVTYTINGSGSYTAEVGSDGKYQFNVAPGSVVAITGITWYDEDDELDSDEQPYTFENGTFPYSFGTVTESDSKDFKAKEYTTSVSIKDTNGNNLASYAGISVSGTWYTQEQDEDEKYTFTSDGAKAVFFKIVGEKAFVSYVSPTGLESGVTASLVITATGVNNYTFDGVTIPSAASEDTLSEIVGDVDGSVIMSGTIKAKEKTVTITVNDKGTNPAIGSGVPTITIYSQIVDSDDEDLYEIATVDEITDAVSSDGNVYKYAYTYEEDSDYTYVEVVTGTNGGIYTFEKDGDPEDGEKTVSQQIKKTGNKVITQNKATINAVEETVAISGTVEDEYDGSLSYNDGESRTTPIVDGEFKFYVVKGSIVTISSIQGYVPKDGFALGTVDSAKTVEFTKTVGTVDPTPVKYRVTLDRQDGADKTVIFNYTVNGEPFEFSQTVVSTADWAEVEIPAYVGDEIVVSATVYGDVVYSVSAFENYQATAVQMETYYFQAVSDNEKAIPGATFDIKYTLDEPVVQKLTSGADGFVSLTLPAGLEFTFAKDGKNVSDDDGDSTIYEFGAFTKVNLGAFYPAAGNAYVKIAYMSAYNSDSVVSGPVLGVSIAGDAKTESIVVGESVALKAPSIDGFEFVAWMVDGVVVSESADYTLKVEKAGVTYDAVALYSAVHYEGPAEGLSMNVLVIGIVILILGILAVAYGIISKKQ